MSIIDEIVPTVELEDATVTAKACQARFEDLQERMARQSGKVNQLAMDLQELILAMNWEIAETPEEAAQAKQQCSELAEHYQQERQLLQAINTALLDTREDASSAGNRVTQIVSRLVSSRLPTLDTVATA